LDDWLLSGDCTSVSDAEGPPGVLVAIAPTEPARNATVDPDLVTSVSPKIHRLRDGLVENCTPCPPSRS
jgi:hypothetical protein